MNKEEKKAGRHFLAAHMAKTRTVPLWSGFGRIFANPAFAGALLTAVLGIGVTRAAEKALPGDTLFPIKTAKEAFTGSLLASTEARAAWEASLTRKRLEEIKLLAEENRLTENAANVAKKNLITHIVTAEARIAELAEENEGASPRAAEIHSKIESTLNAYGKILDWKGLADIAQAVTAEAKKIETARARTEKKAIERNKAQEHSVREQIEQDLEKTEKTIQRTKPKKGDLKPVTAASKEADRILDSAAEDVTQSRTKLEEGSYDEAFLLEQESKRETDEAVILIETDSSTEVSIPTNVSLPVIEAPPVLKILPTQIKKERP